MKVGDKVEVKLTKDWVTILKIKDNQFYCRTKAYEIIIFYDFELEEIK